MKQSKVERSWRRWTEDEAGAALDELARSGESAADFARRRGVSAQRIRYWKKRLGERTEQPAFVALTLPDVAAVRHSTLEVRIDDIIVAVPLHSDVEQVASLVSAIARRRRAC